MRLKVVSIVQKTCNGKISQVNVAPCSVQVEPARGSCVVKGRRACKCGIPHPRPLNTCVGREVQSAADDIGPTGNPNHLLSRRGVDAILKCRSAICNSVTHRPETRDGERIRWRREW